MSDAVTDKKHGHGDNHSHDHMVTVEVNGKDVQMSGKTATGLEIKQAAVTQGVNIQSTFVLQQDLPNGSSEVVGDTDEVKLRPNLRFTAIAPDDNS